MKINLLKSTIISAIAALLSLSANAQTPTWAWAIDSDGEGTEDGTKSVLSDNGSIYTLVRHNDSFSFGGIDVDAPVPRPSSPGANSFHVLSKITSSGEVLWIENFIGTASGNIHFSLLDVSVDSDDNIYLAGNVLRGTNEGAIQVNFAGVQFTFPEASSTNNAFLAKLDPDGNGIWIRNIATPEHPTPISVSGRAIAIDENGLLYWQGFFQTQIEINGELFSSAGAYDTFLSCLNTDGEFLWSATIGSENNEPLDAMANIASAAGGGVLISASWTGDTMTIGNLSVTNPDALIGQNADRWIAKFDASGSPQWLVREGSLAHDGVASLASTPSGGAMVMSKLVGSAPITINNETFEGEGMLLSRYSSAGILEHAAHFPNNEFLIVNSIMPDGNDFYFVGITFRAATFTLGDFQLNNAGGLSNTEDFIIAALDMNFMPIWAVSTGSAESDWLRSLAYSQNHGLVATGFYTSAQLEIGSTTLTNDGFFTRDLFMAALDFTSSVTSAPGVQPLHLYPNPADLHVSVDLTSLSDQQHSLRIFDTRGLLVLSQNVTGGAVETIEVRNLPKGSYVIIIQTNGITYASKIIKL